MMRSWINISSWWVLAVGIGLACGNASGLIIYRFGGESLPPPPELEGEGSGDVEYFPLKWSDLDPALGGETYQLDMDELGIRALEYDPQVNIATTVEERGGSVFGERVNGIVFDGDLSTMWKVQEYICAELRAGNYMTGLCDHGYAAPGTATLILGGQFLIDRVRIVSGLENEAGVVRDVRIHLATQVPFLRPNWHPSPHRPIIVEVRSNTDHILDIPIPVHEKAAFLQVAIGEHKGVWDVQEIEVFAKGFVDKSTYVSSILDFGHDAAWGELRWSGFREPGAKLFIQTRSGVDEDPSLYWQYTGRGNEKVDVTKAEYNKLKIGEKAGATHDQDNWTFWSAPYEFADSSGAAVVSLSPRRYLQLKMDFIPQGDAGSGLEFLELRASIPPVASNLVGEISPTQVEVGEVSRFTYVFKPTIQGEDTGFDRLEIRTSSILKSIESVRLDGIEVEFQKEELDEHGLAVRFPRLDKNSSGALVEVVFEAQVLRYGTSFDARVFDSSRPLEVPQGINAGDASDEFERNTATVSTSVSIRSLLEVGVRPRSFTPNGDEINDRAHIFYDLFETTDTIPVTVEIRDLAGRLIRTVYTGEDMIGHYERPWDGTNDSRHLVPPGVYLYRVTTTTDEQQTDKLGTLHLVY